MRLRLFAGTAMLALAASVATVPARAAYIVTFAQVGPDVVAAGSGSLNINSLAFLGGGAGDGSSFSAGVSPSTADVTTGAAADFDLYLVGTGPSSFGLGGTTSASGASGDPVGVLGGVVIVVPTGYASNTALTDTATYAGQTIASLGLTPGAYVYSFGSGANADTFTVDVTSVPEPASLSLLGAGLFGFAMTRRKRS